MSESLGEKLRKAREEREVSISEVAEQTRISALYLEAIERDDYRPLPGGIFNKGFVKSFAKYVGVDESEALQDYARIAASQEADGSEEGERYKPEVLTDDRSGPSLIPTVIFAVVILGLLAWGVMLLVNYFQGPEAANGSATTSTPVPGTAPANANLTPDRTPLPAIDKIELTIATTTDALSVQSTIDGQTGAVTIPAGSSWDATGTESVKVIYYKGLAGTLQISVNGQKVETPLPPADYKRNGFEFEINRGNIKNILESGKITLQTEGAAGGAGEPQEPATVQNSNSG